VSGVTVIVPCFRNAATIERALRSVFEQSTPPLEVVAVDDASTDDTLPRLRTLQSRFGEDRLRVLELATNGGPSAARNAGWKLARGDFVAFLDADDTWHPRKLEIQVDFMRKRAEFPMTAHLLTFGEHVPLPGDGGFTEVRFRSMLYRNWFHTSSVMMRKELPQRFDAAKRYGEDRQLWLEVAAAGHRIARLDLPLLRVYKPMYGASGLSAHLWAMEAAELETFRGLRRAGLIGAPLMYGLLAWSLARYARRRIVVALR
jgi:glycosyltransferase involved in cell wall biosynthesis